MLVISCPPRHCLADHLVHPSVSPPPSQAPPPSLPPFFHKKPRGLPGASLLPPACALRLARLAPAGAEALEAGEGEPVAEGVGRLEPGGPVRGQQPLATRAATRRLPEPFFEGVSRYERKEFLKPREGWGVWGTLKKECPLLEMLWVGGVPC